MPVSSSYLYSVIRNKTVTSLYKLNSGFGFARAAFADYKNALSVYLAQNTVAGYSGSKTCIKKLNKICKKRRCFLTCSERGTPCFINCCSKCSGVSRPLVTTAAAGLRLSQLSSAFIWRSLLIFCKSRIPSNRVSVSFGVKIIKISRKDDTWSVYLICFYQNFICVLGHIDSFKTVRIHNLWSDTV